MPSKRDLSEKPFMGAFAGASFVSAAMDDADEAVSP
jgi:hypothetical protein